MTMQITDTLLWKDTELNFMFSGPLMEAWDEASQPKFEPMSSCCWRGYFASWIIDDNDWLRLVSVKSGSAEELDEEGQPMTVMGAYEKIFELFPGHDTPITALWFTGEFSACVGYQPMRMRSNEKFFYKVFTITGGKVTKVRDEVDEFVSELTIEQIFSQDS
jgi:hypothetical protein